MDRPFVLSRLAERILSLPDSRPLRIALDGPDAAGKTTLADELAGVLQTSNRPILRASIDRFHNPRQIRYRQGEHSPAGYYEDSFDLNALRASLLDPLGAGGSRVIQLARFDYQTDQPAQEAQTWFRAADHSILIFDGIFLLRPELVEAWDFRIFVRVDFATILARAEQRDQALLGSREAVRTRYLNRYLPAQQYYISHIQPERMADAVVVNDDPQHPDLCFRTDQPCSGQPA